MCGGSLVESPTTRLTTFGKLAGLRVDHFCGAIPGAALAATSIALFGASALAGAEIPAAQLVP